MNQVKGQLMHIIFIVIKKFIFQVKYQSWLYAILTKMFTNAKMFT